jgi:hypothetical protein
MAVTSVKKPRAAFIKFNGGRLSGATVSAHLMPQVLTLAV